MVGPTDGVAVEEVVVQTIAGVENKDVAPRGNGEAGVALGSTVTRCITFTVAVMKPGDCGCLHLNVAATLAPVLEQHILAPVR